MYVTINNCSAKYSRTTGNGTITRKINIVIANAIITPLLVLIVIVAVVKRIAKKKIIIATGIIPNTTGSKKYMIPASVPQRTIIKSKAGK